MQFEPKDLCIVVEECRQLLKQVDAANPQLIDNKYNFTLLSLFHSMVEIGASIEILCSAELSVGVPILGRSFHEGG